MVKLTLRSNRHVINIVCLQNVKSNNEQLEEGGKYNQMHHTIFPPRIKTRATGVRWDLGLRVRYRLGRVRAVGRGWRVRPRGAVWESSGRWKGLYKKRRAYTSSGLFCEDIDLYRATSDRCVKLLSTRPQPLSLSLSLSLHCALSLSLHCFSLSLSLSLSFFLFFYLPFLLFSFYFSSST